MEDFKERIFWFVKEHVGCSNREFERRCGLTNGQVSSIGAQGPTASVISRIANTYPELNLNWLFRGEGEMILSEKPDNIVPVQNDIHHNSTVNFNYGELKEIIIKAIKEAKQ